MPALQRVLFGPQRPVLNLGEVFAGDTIPDGPVGVISAGWQEAEGDFSELGAIIGRPLLDLDLYHRAEKVFAGDEELYSAYRQRQDRLQELQRLYRQRLRQLMIAARQVKRADAAADLVAAEYRHAIAQLRALDRHHLHRIESVYAEFAGSISVGNSALLASQIAAIEELVADCATLVLTGGNVMVLLNRLQLFGMRSLLAGRHLVAWSAGAMALSDRVVLFHDSQSLGRRDAELLGAGMGVVPGYVLLPDARRRLQGRDALRVSLFSGRFSPASCVTLDSGACLRFEDHAVASARGVDYLTPRGGFARLRSP